MRLASILERGLWTDCELSVGAAAVRVPAHRLLLASASPVLSNMFFGPLPMPSDQTLRLEFIEPEIAPVLLKYIYTDNIVLNSYNDACNLYRAAHYLLMFHLKAACKAYLVNSISAETVLRIYEFAESYDEKDLMQKCMKVMQKETPSILERVGKSPESPKIETLMKLFVQPDLNVDSEIDLIRAVDRWARQKQQAKTYQLDEVEDAQNTAKDSRLNDKARLMLRPVLQKIRFLTIDPDDFVQYDMTHLLSTSDLLAISYNLLSRQSVLPMPAGFTTSRDPRKLSLLASRIVLRLHQLAALQQTNAFFLVTKLACEPDSAASASACSAAASKCILLGN
ncbi:BTB/POZ domain-containing protein [Phthorimaea operculella]|nr:BTB/POZ domain-containing protein [Phthorimaea operculella]